MQGCLPSKEKNYLATLLSSRHANNLVAANETKKLVMVLDLTKRKERVDMFDENWDTFCTAKKTF